VTFSKINLANTVIYLFSLCLFLLSLSASAASLEGVRISQANNDTRVVFDLSAMVHYKIFKLANPDRVVIDIKNSVKSSAVKTPSLSATTISNIRYAAKEKGTLRLVLDLKNAVRFDSALLKPSAGHNYRLVIDLHSAKTAILATAKPPVQAKPTTVVKPAQTKMVTAKPKPAPVQAKAPQMTPKPAEMILPKPVKKEPPRKIIVAIDAGHGGKDSGAIGYKKTMEKDIVLSIAKRLAKLVNEEPGMKAYLTRTKDVFIPLRGRIKKAHDQNADLFISIHADAFKNTKARGASVFVLSERGASSEAAKLLADKENAADFVGGISLESSDDLLKSVLLDLSQTGSLLASLEVANTVLAGLKRVGHVHKKTVESASFVVLKSHDIPSILVETAFISNPAEERKLNSSSHQNKLARAMMSGIRNYFQRNPLPGTIHEQQHIVSRGETLSSIAKRYQITTSSLKTNNNLHSTQLKVGDVLLIP